MREKKQSMVSGREADADGACEVSQDLLGIQVEFFLRSSTSGLLVSMN